MINGVIPFLQLAAQTSDGKTGLGLILNIARQINNTQAGLESETLPYEVPFLIGKEAGVDVKAAQVLFGSFFNSCG